MATTKENYYFLHNLLAAGKWEEADRTTYTIISGLAGGTVLRGFDNLPCEDLRTINQLWLHYSQGKFGFSVQKDIYESLGGTSLQRNLESLKRSEGWRSASDKELYEFDYNHRILEKFAYRVSWRRENWEYPDTFTFNLMTAPQGHLPFSHCFDVGVNAVHKVAKRLVTCSTIR
ncbi:GUN4 domain-containing protein [Microcystis aeruginosa]|jgi:hypothetical protein|uniref:GUN4 domain protein n=1 Tax=Microcystis aeruginosa PCC 9443 TaxID=1160281 RepID=I4G0H5_MICAE